MRIDEVERDEADVAGFGGVLEFDGGGAGLTARRRGGGYISSFTKEGGV